MELVLLDQVVGNIFIAFLSPGSVMAVTPNIFQRNVILILFFSSHKYIVHIKHVLHVVE